jgi:hypothetical protein
MAENLAALKARMKTILTSTTCQQIRFKMENIVIQWGMYGYIAGRIDTGHVRVEIGNANFGVIAPDRHTYILTVEADVPAQTIVHEATHAVIWATQTGLTLTKEAHEAAAYLADSMYGLLTGDGVNTQVAGLDRVVGPLAGQAIAFNKTHNTAFVCPGGEVATMKAIYKSSPLGRDNTTTQGGLGDDKPRLPAWLQGWWSVVDVTQWYYHFSAIGVAVTKIKPAGASAPPPNSPDRGGVTVSPVISPHVVVSWSPGEPGSTIEKFTRVGILPEKMEGVSNLGTRLFATKLT